MSDPLTSFRWVEPVATHLAQSPSRWHLKVEGGVVGSMKMTGARRNTTPARAQHATAQHASFYQYGGSK